MYESAVILPPPNPWLRIWTEPRSTIRHLTHADPERGLILLAALGGVSQSLSQAMDRDAGEALSLPVIVLSSVVLGSVVGVVALYVGAYLVQWTGRWIDGQGSIAHIRTALAWANVPVVALLPLTLLLIAALGPLPFLSEDTIDGLPIGFGAAMLMLAYGVASAVCGIWSFVVLLKALGEVQGFSAWKAWGNLLLCLLPFIALGVLAAVVIPILAT
jgi:hypothetical protein